MAGGIVARLAGRISHWQRREEKLSPVPEDAMTEAEKVLSWEAHSLLYREEENPGGNCLRNVEFLVKNAPDLMRQVIADCADEEKKDFWSRRFSNQYVAPQDAEYEPAPGWLTKKKLERVRQSLVSVSAASSLFTAEDRDHMFFESSAYYYVVSLAVRLASEDASDERIRACTAMAYIHGVHRRDIFPDNVRLPASEIDFFVEHYSQIEPFVPQLFTRRSTDSSFIRTMINGDTPVLADGAL